MSDNRATWTPFAGFESLWAAWMGALSPPDARGSMNELGAWLLNPRQWLGIGGAALEQPFETVLGLPRLADVSEVHRHVLTMVQGWMGVALRGTEYSAVVAQVWAAAYVDFLQGLQASAAEGRPVRSGRELLDRWTSAVNERLLKAQRSDSFLDAQRGLLDAMLTSRAAERWLVDVAAKAADMPGRGEMDDVHRTLHKVKRELRALERRLAEADAAPQGDDGAGQGGGR